MKVNVEISLTQNEVQNILNGVNIDRLDHRLNEDLRRQFLDASEEGQWSDSLFSGNLSADRGGWESLKQYCAALDEIKEYLN